MAKDFLILAVRNSSTRLTIYNSCYGVGMKCPYWLMKPWSLAGSTVAPLGGEALVEVGG